MHSVLICSALVCMDVDMLPVWISICYQKVVLSLPPN